jgi:hypothetical protein
MMSSSYKQLARLAVVSLFLNNVVLCATPASMSYADVGNQLISSYGTVQQAVAPKPKEKDAEKDYNFFDELKLDVVALTPQERLQKLFTIFSRDEATTQQPAAATHDPVAQAVRTMINDLELLCSHDEQHRSEHVFSKLDNTVTTFGKIAFAKMLANPITNKATLQARQAFVQELVNNEALFAQYDATLKQIYAAEPAILAHWAEHNKETKQFLAMFYYQWKFLSRFNKNPMVLQAPQCMNLVFLPLLVLGQGGIALATLVGRGPISYLEQMITPPGTQLSTAAIAALRIFYASMIGFGVKNSIDIVSAVYKASNYLQNRLIGAATLVTNAKKITQLVQASPAATRSITTHVKIQELFNSLNTRSDDFATLLGYLQTNTFKGKASTFSYTGRVLAANTLMDETKEQLTDFMKYIGELDACMSIAKLYKKFQNERVHYTFVEYVDGSTTPYIKLEGFWNPMVNPAKVVTNTLELGARGNMRDMILTGANTGGKSTMLKAIMTAMLFAHTLGIAPADNAVITPCDFLGTSLNIIDNTAGGKSLYQAEVDRTTSLIKMAQRMQKEGKLCFLVLDELFRGTRPEKADKETYECAKRLVDLDNTSFILATHYLNNPVKLEGETKGLVRNYKIDAYVGANGQIIHTYKLEPGVTQHNIAGEILQNAFDEDDSN